MNADKIRIYPRSSVVLRFLAFTLTAARSRLALRRAIWLLRLLLLLLLSARCNWPRLWLCARSLLLRCWLTAHRCWFTTHVWLWPLLRNNYASLLLSLSSWCCDSFALRLLLSHRSRCTFSLRRTCRTFRSSL